MRNALKSILAAFILSLSMISGLQAFAEDNAQFFKVIEEPSEQVLVLNAVKQSSIELQNPCASAQFTNVNKFSIYQPLKFDSTGKVIAGAWKQTVLEHGCGEDRVLNVVVMFDASTNGLKAVPLLPGTTRADPILQNDAVIYASMAAATPDDKACETTYIANTEFLHEIGEPLEGAKGKPWDELWLLVSCGKKAQVTMHFIPDKTGTTINASPTETKFLPGQ